MKQEGIAGVALLRKIHVFYIGKGKMAVDEVFQLTSTAKLRVLK